MSESSELLKAAAVEFTLRQDNKVLQRMCESKDREITRLRKQIKELRDE